jgi:hypothetical protein
MPAYTLQEAAKLLERDYTVREGAALLADGQPWRSFYDRLAGLARRELIDTRINDAPDGPRFKIGLDGLGNAAAILALHDIGVSDTEVAQHARLALHAWDDPRNMRPPGVPEGFSPIMAAMIGACRGEQWLLEVAIFNHMHNGRRQLQAAAFKKDGPPPGTGNLPLAFLPRAKITVELAEILLPLMKAAEKHWRGN